MLIFVYSICISFYQLMLIFREICQLQFYRHLSHSMIYTMQLLVFAFICFYVQLSHKLYVAFHQACFAVLQSWVSRKFMTGWQNIIFFQDFTVRTYYQSLTSNSSSLIQHCSVVLFPVAVTFFITWWFIQFVDGFFSPLYEKLGVDIFGKAFNTVIMHCLCCLCCLCLQWLR